MTLNYELPCKKLESNNDTISECDQRHPQNVLANVKFSNPKGISCYFGAALTAIIHVDHILKRPFPPITQDHNFQNELFKLLKTRDHQAQIIDPMPLLCRWVDERMPHNLELKTEQSPAEILFESK